MNWFKKKIIKKEEEQCTIHSVMPRFSKIIDKWLTIRDESEDSFWYEPSEEDSFFPKYVMRMMREINEEMPKPMLDEIKSNEICAMGHVDYAHKFALYCAELYLNEA